MLPDIASSISASVGCGLLASSAEAELRAGHTEHVAQYPEQRGVAVDIDGVIYAIDLDRDCRSQRSNSNKAHPNPSFRGAAPAASPEPIFQRPVCIGSGLLPSGGPGMTVAASKALREGIDPRIASLAPRWPTIESRFRGQVDDPPTSKRIFPPRCACRTASLMEERG